ncbi:hypothetical protein F8388_013071 [Cannabis sativa]|uniref:Uncharacterized protein n=1 Tax=Cannabis sativa TaxID=3483 RepID=A0A7J6EBH1_CANSA|nr:hypothetical protein F8388_013071 [Cannabis sativa]KAF4393697.1 hypothetical protein G4B88_007683 [Cannabis sativa]
MAFDETFLIASQTSPKTTFSSINQIKALTDSHSSTSESVQSTALSLQSIDDVHGGNSLPASVLSVSDGVTDNVLKKDLEYTASLLVDETADTLNAATSGQTANRRLGDSLDVVPENLTMPLGSSLSQTLSSFSSS